MTDYTDLIVKVRMIASILRPLPNIRLSECDALDEAAAAIAALQAEVARLRDELGEDEPAKIDPETLAAIRRNSRKAAEAQDRAWNAEHPLFGPRE